MARARAWLATAMSVLSAALVLLTAFVPDWVEQLLGVAPDGGDGSVEIAITMAVLLAVAVTSGLAARSAWRALRRGPC